MHGEDESRNGLIICIFLGFFAVVVLRNAWVCDDAYISFRVVDNFVHGYGLTWNTAERVQAFTNPLWVLLLSPFYAVTGEIFFTSIFVSVVLVLATAAILGFKLAARWETAAAAILILTVSDAFVDYSTSGLENPLTYFLIIAFSYLFFRPRLTVYSLFILSLVMALAALNRPDTILMYLPPVAYAFWKVRGRRAVMAVLLGLSPLLLWELFSLFYFGFPVPNTAYAKLRTGIESSILMEQGVCYLINSLNVDPVTVFVIGGALAVPFVVKDAKLRALSLGLLLILLYIVRIGGCFMSGRHLAAPLLLSVAALTRIQSLFTRKSLLVTVGIILILGLSQEFSPVRTRYDHAQNHEPVFFPNSITDERKFYFAQSGLINYIRNAAWPVGGWTDQGRQLRQEGSGVYVTGFIGRIGFFAGPDVHIIDFNALADPLLARLPVTNKINPAIGHFRRLLPPGYEETIRSGENRIENKSLAEYYDKLALIIRGDLWSAGRLVEVAKFNLGWYDHLIAEYFELNTIDVNLQDLSRPKSKGTRWDADGNIVVQARTVRISLDSVWHAGKIEISHDNNDDYRIVFKLDQETVGQFTIPASILYMEGLDIDTVDVPSDAVEKGYNRLLIYPEEGDGMYSIGHLYLFE